MFINLPKYIVSFSLFFLIPLFVFPYDNGQPSFKGLFHNFGHNLRGSFSKDYGTYHLSTAVLSYGLVQSDADWCYYSFMTENQAIPSIGMAAVITGGLIPVTVPLYLYYRGKSNHDDQMVYSALAMGQSVIISLLVSSTYKAITGREGPEIFDDTARKENYSEEFHFGFMRRGIFEGWPSGHTMNAFAMAGALTEMYPDNKNVKLFAWLYAFFIGIGVSTNIHWFSDCVAGALIGYSIGKTVGNSYRKLYDGDSEKSASGFYFTPTGLGYNMRF
jgi:membrane-associated phospholipid phosphatase